MEVLVIGNRRFLPRDGGETRPEEEGLDPRTVPFRTAYTFLSYMTCVRLQSYHVWVYDRS